MRDRAAITTTDAERRATTPEGMQDAIDAAVRMAGSSARAFARPRRVSRSLVDPTSLSFVFLSPPLARGLVGGFGFAFDRDAASPGAEASKRETGAATAARSQPNAPLSGACPDLRAPGPRKA